VSVTTPADIIRLVLKDTGVLGVGQSASAEDTNDLFDTMNIMIAEWNSKRWLLFHLIDVSLVSTGQISYTIGTGGDFNTPRPDRLENGCFFRQLITASSPNQIDYPLEILESREDYSRIALKQLLTIPQFIFYDPGFPLGTIYPWPVPQATTYELHLLLKSQLSQFANLADTIELPAQYFGALRYNLACRVRSMYQLPPEPTLISLATDALNVLRNANAAIPRLRMPAGIAKGSKYNIFSDQRY
jgi:hypothetical protein